MVGSTEARGANVDPVETGEGSAVPAFPAISLTVQGATRMSQFASAYPNSRKIHVEGPQEVRVPMREIALSHGEPPLRVYDTSGPQDFAPADGLPKLRDGWVAPRRARAR